MTVELNTPAVRVGECNQCGECCRSLGWLCVHADDETADWIRVRDPRIRVVPDEDVKDYHWVSIPYVCTHLVEVGDGRFFCELHGSKPDVCRRYPEPTDDLKPGCGYSFFRG